MHQNDVCIANLGVDPAKREPRERVHKRAFDAAFAEKQERTDENREHEVYPIVTCCSTS